MTMRFWRLGALISAMALAGCSGNTSPSLCSVSSDCATGQTCQSGVCTLGSTDSGVTSCNFNSDCASGQTCTSGVCTTAAATSTIGNACTLSSSGTSSCPSGEVCLTPGDGFPNGYCSAACAAKACPTGSLCSDLTTTDVGEKACTVDCNFNSDCRTGYVCCTGYHNTCVPTAFCGGTGGGAGGGTVGTGGGSAGGTGGGSAGGTGGGSAGGTGGGSAGGTGGGSAGGTGGGSAGGTGGGSAGGTGGGSAGGSAGGSGGGSAGGSAGGSGGGSGETNPPSDGGVATCSAPTMANGGMVGPASMPSCQKPVMAPTLNAGETVQNLGRTQVGSTVSFYVDGGVGSISIVQQVWDAGAPDTITIADDQGDTEDIANIITPLAVTDPSGNSYFTFDANFTGSAGDPATVEIDQADFQVGTEALTFPNTSQGLTHESGGYAKGNWSFQVGDFAYLCQSQESVFEEYLQAIGASTCSGGSATTYYDVRVVTKQIPGSTGTVNVALYMVSSNWTAATAMSSPAWARFVASLSKLYGHAGLCIGTVTFYDVPAWAKTAYASGLTDGDASPCGNLYQMLTLSKTGSAVNLFFVDSIDTTNSAGLDSSSQFPGTTAVSGPIGGPLGFAGTEYSGVAIDVSDISAACATGTDYVNCGADAVAYVAAHKTGHQLGLYHPTESMLDSSGNAYFDPLTDTPECDPTSCDANSDGTVSPSECADSSASTGTCGGGDELMFWSVDNATSAGNISAQQAQLIRTSTVVQASASSARSKQ